MSGRGRKERHADIVARGSLPVLLLPGDRPEPPHVHVERDNHIAKFWLDPVALESSGGMRPYELRRIERIIEAHEESFLREWNVRFND